VALTYAGFAIAGGNHLQVWEPTGSFKVTDLLPGAAFTGVVLGIITGAIVGSLQWIVLRSWAPAVRWWIPLTALGFGIVHGFNDALTYRPLDLPVIHILDGVVVGTAQWFALRRVLLRAWLWLPAVAIAWVAGSTIAVALLGQVTGDPLAELFVGWGSAGLVIGAVTGAVLVAERSGEVATEPARP